MCQSTNGKIEVLKERVAWKVVQKPLHHSLLHSLSEGQVVSRGPFYHTEFLKSGWSRSATPKFRTSSFWGEKNRWTQSGYHVFCTYAGAMEYMGDSRGLRVIKVKIKGRALPFRTFGYRRWNGTEIVLIKPPEKVYRKGYAVQYWKPA